MARFMYWNAIRISSFCSNRSTPFSMRERQISQLAICRSAVILYLTSNPFLIIRSPLIHSRYFSHIRRNSLIVSAKLPYGLIFNISRDTPSIALGTIGLMSYLGKIAVEIHFTLLLSSQSAAQPCPIA